MLIDDHILARRVMVSRSKESGLVTPRPHITHSTNPTIWVPTTPRIVSTERLKLFALHMTPRTKRHTRFGHVVPGLSSVHLGTRTFPFRELQVGGFPVSQASGANLRACDLNICILVRM